MDTLLLIDDDADMQYSFRRIFDVPEIKLTTASSGEEGLRLLPKLRPDLVIMDIRMGGLSGLETLGRMRQIDARLPVIMMTAYGTTQTAIEAMKQGAYDYLLKPFDVPRLKQTVFAALKAARDMKAVVSYEPLLESEDYELGIVGRCEGMQSVFKLIGQLATSDATALITGESGTGKELVARAIYHHSRRAQRSFVAINCAAIPESLLESELFGHERGAFTGAGAQRIGKFEQSHGGTIFLDEIGDMLLPTQTKILRVLQDGSFERVGGVEPLKADVRIIAATNQDIERAVAERRFRGDLFYRLNVVRLRLPALRERRGDVRLLVNYFLKKIARASGQAPKSISPEALDVLERHRWPGNVRELENVIHRAIVVAKGTAILPNDLPAEVVGIGGAASDAADRGGAGVDQERADDAERRRATAADAASGAGPVGATDVGALAADLFAWARQHPKLKVLPAVERELVLRALAVTRGNQVQAAGMLGITRATLRKRMDRFGIRSEMTFQ